MLKFRSILPVRFPVLEPLTRKVLHLAFGYAQELIKHCRRFLQAARVRQTGSKPATNFVDRIHHLLETVDRLSIPARHEQSASPQPGDPVLVTWVELRCNFVLLDRLVYSPDRHEIDSIDRTQARVVRIQLDAGLQVQTGQVIVAPEEAGQSKCPSASAASLVQLDRTLGQIQGCSQGGCPILYPPRIVVHQMTLAQLGIRLSHRGVEPNGGL